MNEAKQPTDTERLNWMESTQTGIHYNVECCAWGVDFYAPYKQTMREAIDAAMTLSEPERTPNSEAKGSSFHQPCSATEHQNRRRVWEELEQIKQWSERLKATLQKEPDGVIPWIQLESISQATSRLVYASGHVNAALLSK